MSTSGNVKEERTSAASRESFEETARKAKRTLIPLLVIYFVGVLCLQAFNMVFDKIGTDVGAPNQASLITAIPGVVLGIVCFVYGSLGDFASLRKMTMFGIAALVLGSVCGFLIHGNLIFVILFRIIQTIGYQTAGSVYLVIVARYLPLKSKLLYFGIFTADYQFATAIGVLCAGIFSTISWAILFLIPVVVIVLVPTLMKNLPGATGGKTHIDVPGFGLFGVGILFLTLFFSMLYWWMLVVSIAFFTLFAVYISKAKDPFITPEFFKNVRWRKAVLLIFIFYFVNYSVTPLVNSFGADVFGLSSSQISFMLLPALIIATITGVCSGQIATSLGKHHAVIVGGSLMAFGLAAAGLTIGLGPIAFGIMIVFFYSGMATIYSPTVDTVLGTLPPEQTGRGVGMNDLAMQGSAAIGIALFGGPIADQPFASLHLLGTQGSGANAMILLVIYAVIVLFGVIWMQLHHKSFYQDIEK
ncbi:MFS transporter [Bifidobacterium choloepi]|uniref:Tetracycline resistance protein n=1 Tax=Bifidobacterium choloepi TaxID=2614131 RepID=A0A6I5N083_9BIFI|nr:MFS transporter [Bifidobacterium choloepi]NEG69525.1 MFS transporter [Bifidobacterium choloepi]